ncbi:hypothetical protein BC834DRAFT_411056 [Gloeopeniophorella convolvens]|nr:hypothetical protein BC834DRAFT_411056 [Gloeopeniophorella convolvens]
MPHDVMGGLRVMVTASGERARRCRCTTSQSIRRGTDRIVSELADSGGRRRLEFLGSLILLSLLALVCLSFASELHFLYSRLFACATSIAARLSAAVHSECSVTIKLKDAELIEKRSALDIALQQIEQGNARIESLYAESRALSSVALDQGRDIRIQSNLIAELEGQLEDTESALEEAIVSGRQHELEAYAYSQEVARVEDRMSTLVAEFNIAYSMMVLNLDSAHAREQQLCKSLDAKNALISDAQAALSASEEAAGKERETLQCELDTWTQNGRHWKAMAEEAEIRTVDADQTALGLRKELAAVYKSAREVKEQLESQAVIIGERDMTIRTLNREVLEVLEQLEEAEDEIARFQSLPDPIDFADVEAWQPPSEPEADSPDSMPARSPPVFEWLGRLTKGDRELSAPRTQARSRSPDMSIGEFTSGHRGVASPKASSGPCDGILLCLASPVASAATPDDPFLVGGVPVSASRQRNPTYPVPGVADSCGMADSMVSHVKMIGELREQIVREQLACAQAEERLLAQQRKMLATEAVVEIQRRQLEYTSAQKVELVKSLAMNVTLGNEVGTLRQQAEAAKAGRDEMAARVTQLEATLSESRTALKAVTKTTEEMRVQWNDAEAVCEARAKEIDAVKAEQDAVDMRLSQMMLLKLALEERVKTLEEAASNRAGSSDRAGVGVRFSPTSTMARAIPASQWKHRRPLSTFRIFTFHHHRPGGVFPTIHLRGLSPGHSSLWSPSPALGRQLTPRHPGCRRAVAGWPGLVPPSYG